MKHPSGIRLADSRKEHAFSLVEMLIVLAVVAILLALTAPTLMSLRSASLSASAGEFSGFLSLCRMKAIAERTSIRVGIVTKALKKDDSFRQYAGWAWDKSTEDYVRFSEWKFLPPDAVFEDEIPEYLKNSSDPEAGKTAAEGDFILADGFQNTAEEQSKDGESRTVKFLTFSPSGRASVEGGEKRNLILVVRGAAQSPGQQVANWFQFSVDTLTGRARTYRP